MEDPDRPGDHACPHTLVTSIPDGIHKHKHTHNVNRWIEAKRLIMPLLGRLNPVWQVYGQTESHRCPCRVTLTLPSILAGTYVITYAAWWRLYL